MKNLWMILKKVIRAYSLEEKVLSILLVAVFVFFSVRGVAMMLGSGSLSEYSSYTEAEISAKPVLINPLFVDFGQANRDISSLVFSGLLKYDPKLSNFVDDLASLKISEDKKNYILTLKDNLKWHDGQALTVDDVMFTYGIIQSAEFQNALLKTNFEGVQIERVDDKTVKFVLNRPNAFFITNLNVGILPKHLLENVEVSALLSNTFNLNPVGAGPYKIAKALETSDDGKQKVTLEKFDNYYGVKPKIGQIRFNIYPDENSLLVEKAAINVIARSTSPLNSLLTNDRFKNISYSLPQYTAVFFNTDSELLKNLKIRLGLIKSVDKEALLAKLDNKVMVDTPLMGLNQKDWIFKPDQKEANGALFDAGYLFKKDEQGNILPGEKYRYDKSGKLLELTLVARAYDEGSSQKQEADDTINFLNESWEKIGVKLNVSWLSEGDFLEAIKTKKYDMVLTGQSMGYNLDTFSYWHSSQAKEGGLNLSNYKSFGADSYIENIREEFDADQKESRQRKLAQLIAQDAPALFLYRPNYQLLTDNKVQNLFLTNLAYPADRFADVADWCVNKECN